MSFTSDVNITNQHPGTISTLSSLDALQNPMDEALDILPRRTLLARLAYAPPLSLNGLMIAGLCLLLLIMLGFVPVMLVSPFEWRALLSKYPAITQWIQYNFQLPFALFIGAFLGPMMGGLVVLSFVLMGLFVYPLFANGGGTDYFLEPGFGYIVGCTCAAIWVGKCFHKAFQKQSGVSRSVKLLLLAIGTVAFMHMIGGCYLIAEALAGQLPWGGVWGNFLRLSIETAPYDLLFSFVFFCMVRQFRLALWLVLY